MRILILSSSVHTESAGTLFEKEKEDLLIKIHERIDHLSRQNGHPDGNLAKRISGVGEFHLCEIRIHHKKDLLRIYYIIDKELKELKILNFIIKPDGSKNASHYEGVSKKKIQKKIKDSIQLAIKLYKKNNYKNYEPFWSATEAKRIHKLQI
jgi:hypothetical protein